MSKPLVYPSVVRGRARMNFDALQSKDVPSNRVVHVLMNSGSFSKRVATLEVGEYVKWPVILRILSSPLELAAVTLGTLNIVSAYAFFIVVKGTEGTLIQVGNISGSLANATGVGLMLPVTIETAVFVRKFVSFIGSYRLTFEIGKIAQEI